MFLTLFAVGCYISTNRTTGVLIIRLYCVSNLYRKKVKKHKCDSFFTTVTSTSSLQQDGLVPMSAGNSYLKMSTAYYVVAATFAFCFKMFRRFVLMMNLVGLSCV